MALHTIEFHHLDFFNQLVSLTTHSKSFQWCTSSYLSNVHSRLKVRAQDLFLSDSFSIASYSLLANFCHLFTIYVTLLWNSLNSLLFTHQILLEIIIAFFFSLSTVFIFVDIFHFVKIPIKLTHSAKFDHFCSLLPSNLIFCHFMLPLY